MLLSIMELIKNKDKNVKEHPQLIDLMNQIKTAELELDSCIIDIEDKFSDTMAPLNETEGSELINSVDAMLNTCRSDFNKKMSEIKTNINKLYNEKIDGSTRDPKAFQLEIDENYNRFYDKTQLLNEYKKKLKVIKDNYISAEAAVSGNDANTKKYIAILWLIFTIFIAIATVSAFLTKKINRITLISCLLFLIVIFSTTILNFFFLLKNKL